MNNPNGFGIFLSGIILGALTLTALIRFSDRPQKQINTMTLQPERCVEAFTLPVPIYRCENEEVVCYSGSVDGQLQCFSRMDLKRYLDR